MISNNSFRSSAAKSRSLVFPLIIVALLACASVANSQEKEPIDVVKVNTDLVVFDVQVIDKKTGRVVGDLNKEDFELSDNGVKQQISYFSRDELPLSIILLLDVSASVRSIIHDIRDGALNALQRLKPDDQVAVMAFSERTRLAQDFTKDRAAVSRKIEEATATSVLGSGTFLGAAMEEAAFHMQTAPTPTSRRVIIVITDNIAPSFASQQRSALHDLFESGTVVYGLIVRGAFGKVFNVLSLGQIKGVNKYVEETGGEVLGADKKEVDAKLSEVIDRLRARYAIGFRPSNSTEEGKFRPVTIKILQTTGRKEKPIVLTKRGYYLRRRKD
jgi:Ca-activated chloride channel family protein